MWDNIKKINSTDENVSKFVFTKADAVAEAVLYKYPTYEDRTVICCSTQSGCPVGCRFCGAGDYFIRSFSAKEIVSQPIYLLEQTGVLTERIQKLQIMFMSMGEPMLNWTNLKPALYELYKKFSNARLLISTSAPRVFDNFENLCQVSQEIPTIGLQFSVHESTNEARKKLIPSATMTLEEIAATGETWSIKTGRRPFFNYCVHYENNKAEDVERLTKLFSPKIWEATLSVICERDEHIAAANERQRSLAENFSSLMVGAGYNVRVFNPAGQDDIGGGCGQLWYVQDWMNQNKHLTKASKGCNLEKIHTPK